MLLEQGFTPTRTVVLASGFDEEVGGTQVSNELFYNRLLPFNFVTV
jgi:acetylornithine deacetylase/succinyl-diaminopimelate desuccinylase-like protein